MMKTHTQLPLLRLSAVALALLSAFGAARADDAEIAAMIKPDSSASVGLVVQNGEKGDRAVFGQYNGMRSQGAYGLLDFDYIVRDDVSGTWMTVKGSNLGLATRELSFSREKQGAWKYTAEYGELERNYPRTINTGMLDAGSTTPTVVRLSKVGSGADIDLSTQRKAATLGYERWVTPNLQLELNFKNESKSGARLWGRGYDCAAYVCGTSTTTAINQAAFVKNAILLLPEAIDSLTKQVDARINFHDEKLAVSAGYYGSFYNDLNGSMNPIVPNSFNNGVGNAFPGYPAVGNNIIAGGGTSLQNVLQSPMALPPDNQAHQFYIDGSYAFTPKTRANFKYAYTHASQTDNFLGMGLPNAPAGMSDLGAKVNTSLFQLGLAAHPMDKLSVTANVRYESKADKTPEAYYNVEPVAVVPATTPASSTVNGGTWFNNNTSSTRAAAKLEASYRLPAGVRATVGFDYSSLEREVPAVLVDEKVAGLGALREKNTDSGYRLELRRSLSDTINGALSYSSSKRSGSDWTVLSTLNPNTAGTSATNLQLINLYCGGQPCYGQQVPADSLLGLSATTAFPMSMADVERDKWKMSMDWNPSERFNLQLVLEDGKDKNSEPFNPVAGQKGWTESAVKLYSLDASFALTDNWKLSAFASHGDQTQHVNHSTGYMIDLNNVNDAAGLGLTGKINSDLEVGANLSYLNDVNKYGVAANTSTSGTLPGPLTVVAPSATNLAQAAIGLPDASFRQIGLKLFGKYALNKKAGLRFDLLHSRVRFNEWQWGYNGVPFTYADNTTVHMQPEQNVTTVALSYVYHF